MGRNPDDVTYDETIVWTLQTHALRMRTLILRTCMDFSTCKYYSVYSELESAIQCFYVAAEPPLFLLNKYA